MTIQSLYELSPETLAMIADMAKPEMASCLEPVYTYGEEC